MLPEKNSFAPIAGLRLLLRRLEKAGTFAQTGMECWSLLNLRNLIAATCEYPKAIKKIEVLKSLVKDTLWMARRYAHGRSSYAVSMYNQSVHRLDAIGLDSLLVPDNVDGKRFADDGMFGEYDPATRRYVKKEGEFLKG